MSFVANANVFVAVQLILQSIRDHLNCFWHRVLILITIHTVIFFQEQNVAGDIFLKYGSLY